MSFQLVYGDNDLVLPLALDAVAEERLVDLISAADSLGSERADLARQITDALCALLDWRIVPPSDKQTKYALAIARELSLVLPPKVLQHREAMTVFLATHAPTYRQKKARR